MFHGLLQTNLQGYPQKQTHACTHRNGGDTHACTHAHARTLQSIMTARMRALLTCTAREHGHGDGPQPCSKACVHLANHFPAPPPPPSLGFVSKQTARFGIGFPIQKHQQGHPEKNMPQHAHLNVPKLKNNLTLVRIAPRLVPYGPAGRARQVGLPEGASKRLSLWIPFKTTQIGTLSKWATLLRTGDCNPSKGTNASVQDNAFIDSEV